MTNLTRNALVFCLVGISVTPVAAQAVWRQVARLTPTDGDTYRKFGYSVAFSEHSILIGAPEGNPGVVGLGDSSGAHDRAYQFDRLNFQQGVTYGNNASGTWFLGTNVTSTDGIVVVSDSGDFTTKGRAIVYDATTGELITTYNSSQSSFSERYGTSIDIDGSHLLVGANAPSPFAGSAYLYDLSSGDLLHRFQETESSGGHFYGSSVALSDSYAFVGSTHVNSQYTGGAVYAYSLESGDLSFVLQAPERVGERFGISMDIDNNWLVVGDYSARVDRVQTGAAFLFDASTGELLREFHAPDGQAGADFGLSVAIDGGLVVVGARDDGEKGDFAGAAYVFDASTGNFLKKLTAADAHERALFGHDVDIDNGDILVGAPGATDYGHYGVAYAFRAVLPGDYDGDGEVTLSDYDAWASASGRMTGDLLADGNGDGVIDAADYTVWRDAYAASTSRSVPEPTSLVALSVVVGTWLLRRGAYRHNSCRFA